MPFSMSVFMLSLTKAHYHLTKCIRNGTRRWKGRERKKLTVEPKLIDICLDPASNRRLIVVNTIDLVVCLDAFVGLVVFSSSLFGMLLAPFAVGRSTKSKKCKCYKVHGIIDYLQSTKKRNVHITKPKQSNFDCCLSHFILNLHSWPLYLLLPLIQLPDISPLVSFRFDSFAFFCYCHSMGWLCDAAVDLYIISCDGIALCVQCTSKARERTLQ